jgi:hypothetical protein
VSAAIGYRSCRAHRAGQAILSAPSLTDSRIVWISIGFVSRRPSYPAHPHSRSRLHDGAANVRNEPFVVQRNATGALGHSETEPRSCTCQCNHIVQRQWGQSLLFRQPPPRSSVHELSAAIAPTTDAFKPDRAQSPPCMCNRSGDCHGYARPRPSRMVSCGLGRCSGSVSNPTQLRW